MLVITFGDVKELSLNSDDAAWKVPTDAAEIHVKSPEAPLTASLK
jgi:hypothetical protein